MSDVSKDKEKTLKVNQETIDILVANIIPTTKYFESRFDHMQYQIDEIKTSIVKLEDNFNKRFEQVDRGFAQVDKRFAQVDKRFEQVDERFKSLEDSIDKKNSIFSTLGELQTMGVKIAIDDFGTGYSSLSYLKRFPVNTLKIDRSFVKDICTNNDDAAITSAIIAMAHSLRLSIVAEGVEDADQLAFLKKRECEVIQGYYFSRPLSASDMTKKFETIGTQAIFQ